MLIALHLDPTDLRAERAFRLQVKERLYRFNYVRNTCYLMLLAIRLILSILLYQEILVQLEKEERLEKLEETFQSVRGDYSRILGMM
jgi:histone acetyltransferase 1